jgi:NADH-quinone oxidoreductase subunit C
LVSKGKAKPGTRASLEQLVAARGLTAGDEWITVRPGDLRDVLLQLRGQGYESLSFMTCVDHLATASYPPPPARFELVYQLRSMSRQKQLRVRCFLDGEAASAPTVSDIYGPANWDEREVFDLFGVSFEGHPDLTRILMPEDWVGHPLRRDFPVGGEAVTFSDEAESWQTAPPEA